MCEVYGARVLKGELDKDSILNRVQTLSKEVSKIIQIFDSELIYGKDHIISACEHAMRAFDQGKAVSDSLAMEILLYTAGDYQIKVALDKLGVKENTKGIAMVFINKNRNEKNKFNKQFNKFCSEFDMKPDDEVLIGDKDTLHKFGISDDELLAVPEDHWLELVLEKVALVDIKK